MDIQKEEESLQKLTPGQYNVRNLVIAVAVLASVVATLWTLDRKSLNATIDRQREVIDMQRKEKTVLMNQLVQCKEEKSEMQEKTTEYERERNRKADSIYYALTAANSALKKANNGR